MAAPPSSIIRGDLSQPVLIGRQLRRRFDDLDQGTLKYVSNSRDSFTPGQALATMPGLTVDDVDSVEDGGGLWEHTLTVIGRLGGERRKRGFPDPTYSLTDWDKVEDVWITTNARKITQGQIGSFGGNTVCVSVNPKPLWGSWFEVRGTFVGIIQNKPRQRTITVNGQTISGDKLVVQLPGGWTTPQRGQAQLPKLVVKDRYYGIAAPPTALIPGPAEPPDPPAVKFFTVSGLDVTRYWPGGWHLASISNEQISDRALNATDWVYEYQYPVTP